VAGVSEAWSERPVGKLGGAAYDYVAEREWLARPGGLALWSTDTRLLFENIRTVGQLPDGSAVLDIPCGGGLAFRGLRDGQRVRYVAADISPDMLARARRKAAAMERNDIEFIEADIQHMPFNDGEFDLCLCFNGLHCLPDPVAAVREIARCLAPGGRLIGDAVVRGAGFRQDVTFKVIRWAGLFGPGGCADDVRAWLDGAGLRIDKLQRSGAILHFTATRE
jgi:SAM-dependent methyltransferase